MQSETQQKQRNHPTVLVSLGQRETRGGPLPPQPVRNLLSHPVGKKDTFEYHMMEVNRINHRQRRFEFFPPICPFLNLSIFQFQIKGRKNMLV